MSEQEHDLPSTSTMALSFAEVQQMLPAGVTLEKSLGESVLTVKLRSVGSAVALTWGGVTMGVYVGLLTQTPLAGVAVASAALYCAIAFLVSRLRVTISDDGLRVKSTPLPLPFLFDRRLRPREGSVEVVQTGRRSGIVAHRIDVVIDSGKRVHVVPDIKDAQQALVLAQYIAQELHIYAPKNVVIPP